MSEFILLSTSQDNIDDGINIPKNNTDKTPVNLTTLTDNINSEQNNHRYKYYEKLKINSEIINTDKYLDNSELSRSLPINIPGKE